MKQITTRYLSNSLHILGKAFRKRHFLTACMPAVLFASLVTLAGRNKEIVVYLLRKGANLGENRNIKNWNTTDEINEMLRKHFVEEPEKN